MPTGIASSREGYATNALANDMIRLASLCHKTNTTRTIENNEQPRIPALDHRRPRV